MNPGGWKVGMIINEHVYNNTNTNDLGQFSDKHAHQHLSQSLFYLFASHSIYITLPSILSCLIRKVWYISVSLNQLSSSVVKKTLTATLSPLHLPIQTSPYRPFPICLTIWICLAMVRCTWQESIIKELWFIMLFRFKTTFVFKHFLTP